MPFGVPAGPVGAEPGPAPPSKHRTILNDVHTDVLDVRYLDGRLHLGTRSGNPPYELHQASDVLFQLKDIDGMSRYTVPDDPAYAFLGAPGTPVWIAPQDPVPGLIYAGWDTESVLPGTLAGDAVDLRLVSATGPGDVEVFQVGSLGEPLRVFSSRETSHRVLRQAVASHVHANWAFSALGRYELTFEATASDLSGQPLNSGPVTYTWHVGGTQESDVSAEPTTAALSVSPPTAEVGDDVTLTGAVTPARAAGWLEFVSGDTVLGHAAVSGGQAVLTTNALAAGAHQLTARFVPANATDFQRSTSPAVAYEVGGDGTSPTTGTTTGTTTTTTGTTSTTSRSGTPTTSRTSCPTATTTQPVSGDAVVLADGHVDYAARIVGGGLVSAVKDGTRAGTTTWREPSRVVFHVVPAAATTVPASGFDFLAPPGTRIWQIPQTQRAGILWLGWNTEEISSGQVRGGVTWSLDRVEGPGTVAVYLFNPFGQPQIVFNSGDGVPDRHEVPLGTHAHGNWAFTKEGIYRVTFTQSATLASGAQVRDSEVVTFAVGSTDPNSVLPAAGGQQTGQATGAGDDCPGADDPGLAYTGTGLGLRLPLSLGVMLLVVGVLVVVIVGRRRGSSPDTSEMDGER